MEILNEGMRLRVQLILIALSCVLSTWAQRTISLPEVTTNAVRPMADIGRQVTLIDSVALKENVALSIADVLAYNSSVFVKNYGRATLSTVSFRGTSPAHTAVTWNGMNINAPMMGMTDFSLIPAYFIDEASLLHGSSSVSATGGGLGGAVQLSTKSIDTPGWSGQYVQGVGSFSTFDEFLRINYGNEKWHTSTRAVLSTSKNDYSYINRDKKENIYDEDHNIIGQYYPKERNKSGAFCDFHLLQEVYFDSEHGDHAQLKLWYVNSNRELPMLTTDYGDDSEFENRQREQTFRGVASWNRQLGRWRLQGDAGYSYTRMAYDYKRDTGNGSLAVMTRSRSTTHTVYGASQADFYLSPKWIFTASAKAHQYLVKSQDNNPFEVLPGSYIFGYEMGRFELTGAVTAKWKPMERIGLSAVVRGEMIGYEFSQPIPALFADFTLVPKWNLVAKASVSRNYRYPSLNDLYFIPGGNPNLLPEKGWSYDVGAQFSIGSAQRYALSGSVTWFNSEIEDWILWLPTTKGFFSPRNVKSVHSYGIELKTDFAMSLGRDWHAGVDANFSWTPSVNNGEPYSDADKSVGKQLPYVPRISAGANIRLSWRNWTLHYKWLHYGRRFTMSDNSETLTGSLPAYYMNNISIERIFRWNALDLSAKIAVNNLFNEEYISVLSHPMPGINFEAFISITPRW